MSQSFEKSCSVKSSQLLELLSRAFSSLLNYVFGLNPLCPHVTCKIFFQKFNFISLPLLHVIFKFTITGYQMKHIFHIISDLLFIYILINPGSPIIIYFAIFVLRLFQYRNLKLFFPFFQSIKKCTLTHPPFRCEFFS